MNDRDLDSQALRKEAHSEERFRAIQERSLDGIAILRSVRDETGAVVDFRAEYLNPVAARLTGLPPEALYGNSLTEVFPGVQTNGLLARFIHVVVSDDPQVFEQHYEADGIDAWYRNMVIRLDDGLAIIFSDITVQKQTETALRASEERFHQFATAVKDIFWISDPTQKKLLYISPAYEQVFGRRQAALYANFMEWIEAIHPDDRTRVARSFFERIYEGTYEEEFRIIRLDGSIRWIRDRGFPIWDVSGKVIRAAGIAEDITLRKEQEAQIELQARMIDAVGQAIIATDPDGAILYWNHSAEELFGWASAEVRGRNVIDVIASGLKHDQVLKIMASLRDGHSRTGEVSVHHRNGSRLEVLATASPVYDPQNNLIGIIGVIVDITSRKRAELERMQLLAFTTALAEAFTPQQVAEVIFEKVHRAIGAQAGTIVLLAEDGHTLEVLGTLDYPPITDIIRRQLDLDMPFPIVDAVRHGQPVWVENPEEAAPYYPRLKEIVPNACAIVALPLTIQQRVIGALGLIFTSPRTFSSDDQVHLQVIANQCAQALERAWLYESERRAHAAAEDAVRTRDDILAMVSHDLRNPLTVILGQAQLMVKQATNLGQQGQELVPRLLVIRDMVSQMDGQLDDLLDAARLRAGQTLYLNREPMDIVALVREVVHTTQATSSRHQIHITTPDTALLCLGDHRRLARVFANLLRNAIVYSPRGGAITVEVRRVTEEKGSWAIVCVRDSGLGIPAADLPRVFERFHRAANVSGLIRGTGLGLASARQIVEQHEGSIEVESVEGQGSTFTVRLPCLDPEE